MVVVFVTARGGTTTGTPAAGIAIVPPSNPMLFETVMLLASGVPRCSGVTLHNVLPLVECDGSVGAEMVAFGADGLSTAQPEATKVAAKATGRVRRERRRIVAMSKVERVGSRNV